MIKIDWNIEDIALALLEYMERQPAFDDYATILFNDECREILKQIDEKLCKMMKYEDAEELEILMFEYAELRCKQYFIKGFAAGVGMQNCMKNGV